MKKSILSITMVILTLAAAGQVRKYSNEFLSIGISARALGMSNATAATVSDVTAGYWNPAGLTHIENNLQLGLMHAEYFAGIAKYDYGALTMQMAKKDRMMAFSLIRFGVDDIPFTLFLIEPDGTINYDNITSFSVADYAFLVSYAQKIGSSGLRIGGNAKVIHRKAGSFASAWGFGLDVGLQYQTGNWRFGVMGRDITTTFNAWSFNFTEEEEEKFAQTNNIIPENSYEITTPKLILAAGYDVQFGEHFGLLAEIDLDVTTDGKRNVLLSADPISVDPHLGIELDYDEFIFLRAGIGNIQRATSDLDGTDITTFQPNMGVGLKIKNIGIDYAYTDIGNQSQVLYSHVFSLKLEINRKSN